MRDLYQRKTELRARNGRSILPVISTSWSLYTKINKFHSLLGLSRAVSRQPIMASISGKTVWNLRWTKWHCGMFFSEYSCFPCQYNSINAPHLSSYSKLFLTDGQTGKAWELPVETHNLRKWDSIIVSLLRSVFCRTKRVPSSRTALIYNWQDKRVKRGCLICGNEQCDREIRAFQQNIAGEADPTMRDKNLVCMPTERSR